MVGDRKVVPNVRLQQIENTIEQTTEVASHQRHGSSAYDDVGRAPETAITLPLAGYRAQTDKLIGFVEQPLRSAPEEEIYGVALLLAVEGGKDSQMPDFIGESIGRGEPI